MSGPVFHLIPHTHWDREWYLTRAGFLARLVPMLDDLVDRLDSEPGFESFLLDGQTVLLEDYLRVRPEQRGRIEALVRAGRLQVGPWYVLADELIPSGESLVRNLLAGTRDAERLGGRLDVLYSPDAFGHPAMMPALAAEFGIRHGVLWRGVGGEPGQRGDLYRWRGPAGADIVIYHLPPDGYEVGAALPTGWAELRDALASRAASPHVAVMVGADHHAPHRSLSAARDAAAGLEPHAEVRVSRLDDFLRQAADAGAALPSLDGELRWSYGYTWTLQGVHGTRAALKRRHSLAELALERGAEPLAALAMLRRARDTRPLLDEAWRALLRSQFHDSICGCTSDPVARRVGNRIEDAATLAGEIARASADALLGNDPDLARERPEHTAPALVVWNPSARRRGGVATVDLTWLRRDVLIGPPGGRVPRLGASPSRADVGEAIGGLPFQLLGRSLAHERLDAPHHYPDQDEVEVTRVALQLPPVEGLGLIVTEDAAAGEPDDVQPVVVTSAGVMENGIVRVRPSRDGTVTLTDLRTGREYRGLFALESTGDVGDTYTYAAPPDDRTVGPSGTPAVAVLAMGPLVGAIEIRVRLVAGRSPAGRGPGRVDVRLVVSLHAGSAAARCTVELDNVACDHRLRLRLPEAAPGGIHVAGGPLGPVRRSPVEVDAAHYPRETPVPTAPAHRYVAAIGGQGLALFSPGFFEYEHTAGGDLLMTMLRAIGQLSRNDLPTRPGHAAWPTPTPEAQSLGHDRLQLAVEPLRSGDDASSIHDAWEDVFLPLRPVWLRQATALVAPAGGITLHGRGLVLSAVKPAAESGGIVLRCYNASDASTDGWWRLPVAAVEAARTRADERSPRPLRLEDGGRRVPFRAAPREIVTVVLKLDLTAADSSVDESTPAAV